MSDDSFPDDDIIFDDAALLQQIDDLTRSPTLNQKKAGNSQGPSSRQLGAGAGPSRNGGGLSRGLNNGRTCLPPPRVGLPKSLKGPGLISDDDDDEFDDVGFDISMDTLDALDSFAQSARLTCPTPPNIHTTNNATAGPSRLPAPPPYKPPAYQPTRSIVQTHLPFRPLSQKKTGKKWDRTAFAKTGRVGRPKGKGKKKSGWDDNDDEEEEEEEEELEFDQFPRPFVDPNLPTPPPKHLPLRSTTPTYIYPINFPKRDYQFEIVRACFLDNTLVALPTGLGKTFIAGVVLLNFYRWFPTGKLVFLMPTKPLVTQQHEACQNSCGIPSADTATVTGDDPEKWRDEAWSQKRVIYATPQSFLIDMAKGRVDPMDIVLLIIDEAHKASGNHSYVQCVSYLQSFHPHFRIVALTATPGRTTEKVQNVVDALHISRVEIREAEAPEIQKYMFKKETYMHRITMSDEIQDVATRWGKLMTPLAGQLIRAGLLHSRASNVMSLKAFAVRQLAMKRPGREIPGNVFPTINLLASMAMAMGYLLEFSLGMFHQSLLQMAGGSRGSKGKPSKAGKNSVQNNPEFRKILDKVENIINDPRRSPVHQHPKLEKVRDLLVQHLASHECDEQELGKKTPTRCMVFCSFRGAVGEIVKVLNSEGTLIRAHKFVGKAGTKDEGDKGLTQAEQKSVIEKFKNGVYNVLVATSIGEEGLDIGEVDFIIIYNCPAESIKMLQRIGRAGRKRDGKIHVLMTEGREDNNWDQAMFNHREIQSEIIHGRNIELYDDVEPLLPDGRQPECVERIQEVDPWVPEQKKSSKRKASAGSLSKISAPKRARGVAVREGAMTGFVSASKLTAGGQTSRRKTGKKRVSKDGWDDELPDITAMAEEAFGSPGKGHLSKHKAPRKSSDKSSEGQRRKKRVIEQGAEVEEKSTPQSMRDQAALDFFNTAPGMKSSPVVVSDGENEEAEEAAPTRSAPARGSAGVSVPLRATVSAGAATAPASRHLAAQNGVLGNRLSQINSSAWMLDVDDEDDVPLSIAGGFKATFKSANVQANGRSAMGPPPLPTKASGKSSAPTTPVQDPSPLLVRRRVLPPADPPQTPGDASDGPRPPAGRSNAARRIIETSSEDSPMPRRPRRNAPKRANGNLARQFIETEAGVSDPSEDEDFDSSGQESESDKRFAGNFQPTQAPAGYNQQRAYIAGLATQVPQGGPVFSRRPDKHTNFLAKARKPILLSQEAPAGPSSQYFTSDSFVVDDDAPLETYSDDD